MKIFEVTEAKVEMCPDACCGKPVTECSCGPDCKHCDCYAKNKAMNEGAYEDGVSDGKQGRTNPRASSIYGPNTGDYQRGVSDGEKQAKVDREKRNSEREEELAPYKKLSKEAAIEKLNDTLKRIFEIRRMFARSRKPENTAELKSEFNKLNKVFNNLNIVLQSEHSLNVQQLVNQARKDFENTNETTSSGAIATSMGGGNGFANGGPGSMIRRGKKPAKKKKR